MSQMDLAGKLGVAFRQVQKYETGLNRLPANRMPQLAGALNVQMGYFYGHGDTAVGVDTAVVSGSIALLTERHAIDLLECFRAMTAPQRNALLEIARTLAAANAVVEARAEQQEDVVACGGLSVRGEVDGSAVSIAPERDPAS